MSVCGQEIRVAADQARTGTREITGAQKKKERDVSSLLPTTLAEKS